MTVFDAAKASVDGGHVSMIASSTPLHAEHGIAATLLRRSASRAARVEGALSDAAQRDDGRLFPVAMFSQQRQRARSRFVADSNAGGG